MDEFKLQMVNISNKRKTKRVAIAQGLVKTKRYVIEKLINNKLPKGNAIVCAKASGILAAKNASNIFPLCHPIEVTDVKIDIEVNLETESVSIQSTVITKARTGVEMEALISVAVAALTIYDMFKSIDRDVIISNIHLLKKTGGKGGTYVRTN